MCDHLKLEEYIKGIIECLLRLKADIELANSIKRYDVNLSAEDIYRDILNALGNKGLVYIASRGKVKKLCLGALPDGKRE